MITNIGVSKPIDNAQIMELDFKESKKTKIKHYFLDSIVVFKDNKNNFYHSMDLFNGNIQLYEDGNIKFGMI